MLHQWSKDLQVVLFAAALLQLFRIVLIAAFSAQATHLSPENLLTVAAAGLRYDVAVGGIWMLPTVLLSIGTAFWRIGHWVARIRGLLAALLVVLAVVAGGADLVYFGEFNDQFNPHIFGLVNDDTRAILITIWKGYHPLLFLAVTIPLSVLAVWALRRWLAWTPGVVMAVTNRRPRWHVRTTWVTALLLLFVALGRGGTLWGEPTRLKQAFIVNDLFLNRTVLNPLQALRFAVSAYLSTRKGSGLAAVWPSGDVNAAARMVAGDQRLAAAGGDLDRLLTHIAPGPVGLRPPRHIFLILNESFSGWPVMPTYRWVGLAPAVSALADRGVYFRNFLSAMYGTIPAIDTLFTGIPFSGLNTNYEPRSASAYPSATAAIFKQLGYRTRFFYGGPLSWERLDAYAPAQGFEEIYGGGDISAVEKGPTNEWGVRDSALFDFVLHTVDDKTPSFNFILTTSNHPPYDLPLDKLGFPLKAVPPPLQPTKAETLKVLGHLWYSDREIGRFVANAEKRLPAPLFAITGDHTSRLQIHFPDDNVMEQYAVPFVLYGPEILPHHIQPPTAGSHLDIPATLVELAAPKGFSYVAFGRDLLTSSSPGFAQGYHFLMGEHLIATYNPDPLVYHLVGETGPLPAAASLKPKVEWFNALHALGWYRVRQGPKLP